MMVRPAGLPDGLELCRGRQPNIDFDFGAGVGRCGCLAAGAARRVFVAPVARVCADASLPANKNAATKARTLARVRRVFHRIVRRFLSDRNVMRMVLPNRRRCDLDKLRLRAEFLDRLCSDIAHS